MVENSSIMESQFSRAERLFGVEAIKTLNLCRVAVFGIGGVGGYVAEALARNGIGTIDIVDDDLVSLSNLNRQIYALHSTLGMPKVEVAKARLLDINPNIKVNAYKIFYTPETKNIFDFTQYDYVIDAIDTVIGKISLIEESKRSNVPIICAMGAGNKLNPLKFEVSDISKTKVCPLARVIRQTLKKRNIKNVKVVYSTEEPQKTYKKSEAKIRKSIPASNAYCPAVMGLIIASEVIKDLINTKQ